MKHQIKCLECDKPASRPLQIISYFNHDFPFCSRHMDYFEGCRATKQAKLLYFALKMKGLPVRLEYSDNGYKRVDIAIPGKLHIEVDGRHHHYIDQAKKDLYRDYHSWKQGVITMHISNALIDDESGFHIVVEKLSEICFSYIQVKSI